MNQQQIIGTAFEYAHISSLSAQIANSIGALISLIKMYERPKAELKLLADLQLLLTEYHFTYTQSALEKFISLQTKS